MKRTDYQKGFPKVLSRLTKGVDYDQIDFLSRFDSIYPREKDSYFIVVAEMKGEIVASGTLMIEKKFIRDAGTCGHVEDIVVAESAGK